MEPLLSLLIAIIIFGAIFWVISVIPMVDWAKIAAQVLVGAIAAVYFIRILAHLL